MQNLQLALEKLNAEQLRAVECTEGQVLVIAGAGSGKTSVLTCRIAMLLAKEVQPSEILAITFTNKAANEMKSRVEKMVGYKAKRIWLSTFHSFSARLLRSEIEKMQGDYKKNFVIYDTSDVKALLKQCLRELSLDEKRFALNNLLAVISNAKNEMLSAEAFQEKAQDYFYRQVAKIFLLYEKKMQENNALDFDDLLMLSVKLLKSNHEVRSFYSEQFRYVLVDEYQDTNKAQYLLIKLLSERHKNIFVVGDVDQSIYAWRGADIRNIMDFEKDFPSAVTIKLEENYRSTKNILLAANALIANNSQRKEKNLWTKGEEGEKIKFYRALNEHDEARYIANIIKKTRNYNYGDIAIFYRTNAQSRVLEEAFLKAGIPYTVFGGQKFYERLEVKNMLAYLRVIANPYDSMSLLRVINVPHRGIGGVSIAKLTEYAKENQLNLFDVVSSASEVSGLGKKILLALEEFALLIMDFVKKKDHLDVYFLLKELLEKSGYLAELEAEHNPQAEARIENLKEMLSLSKEFGQEEGERGLDAFLEHVALITDVDAKDIGGEKLTMMTVHAAKGLEFPLVFVAGLDEGMFPHQRTLESELEIEEERRLCYVAMTRAKKELYLTNTMERMIFGNFSISRPSRFLKEIPLEFIEGQSLSHNNKQNDFKKENISYKSSLKDNKAFIKQSVNLSLGNKSFLKGTSSANAKTVLDLTAGDFVEHKKFGRGKVKSVSGYGENQEIIIDFAEIGIKKLLTQYAPLVKS